MKERGIIFSGEMVKAILDGRKTQTRRVVKLPDDTFDHVDQMVDLRNPGVFWRFSMSADGATQCHDVECPYGHVGSHLWVRETWADVNTENGPAILYQANHGVHFCTDDAYPVEYERYPNCQFTMWWSDLVYREARKCTSDHKWRPSIHMPRRFSRITLEITGVRVERLTEISEADAIAEGFSGETIDASESQTAGLLGLSLPRYRFACAWERLNAKRGHSWESNPWVWVIEFKRHPHD